MRFDKFNRLSEAAQNETKKGGDTQQGMVFAILALAEAALAQAEALERIADHLDWSRT